MSIRTLLTTVIVLLCGCTSAPVRYHTLLSPVSPPHAVQAAPYDIDVFAPGVPSQLDGQQVVVRLGQSGMAIRENERWLNPLGEELQRALSAGMSAQLGAQDVDGLAREPSRPVVLIQLQLRRFDSWPGHALSLEADWRLAVKGNGQRGVLLCQSSLTRALTGQDDMYAAWQTQVAQLAGQIASTLSQWAASGYQHAVCPR
ncbi:PqiC family protein [Kosakonia sp. WA-90]|uniref:PqiC family protein n=1 Tax=Kosakonia sp. WA-90 TaxID=3153576 RepID=UPI00325D28A2